MKIMFLGTGSIIPEPRLNGGVARSYTGILVKVGDEYLLFDVGPGVLQKMIERGYDITQKPDRLFITHYHMDHNADYAPLVKARCFIPKTGAVGVGKNLRVYGPTRLKEFSKNVFEDTERWSYMGRDLRYKKVVTLKEVDSGLVEETENWKVTCIPVEHYDGVAFRLDAGGKSFVYSGDMAYDENISKIGKGADLVAIECSYPDRETLKGKHLCPEDIAKLAEKGNFKRIVLTHMYPQCNGREKEMIAKIGKPGRKTVAAFDGMEIEI